jgi:hypothetical protein
MKKTNKFRSDENGRKKDNRQQLVKNLWKKIYAKSKRSRNDELTSFAKFDRTRFFEIPTKFQHDVVYNYKRMCWKALLLLFDFKIDILGINNEQVDFEAEQLTKQACKQ